MRRTLRLVFVILYALGGVGILAATFFSPSFRSLAYAPLRELILPEPQPITLSVYYSTEKEAWLENVLTDFYTTNPQVQGRSIQLEMKKFGSREMYLAVLDGEQPDIISPASSLQIAILEDLSNSKFNTPIVNSRDTEQCRSVVETPLVLVAWDERAEALWGDNPEPDVWQSLHDVLVDPRGWDAHGHPEWGYIKFGQTNPLLSNSGFMTILLLTYDYLGKTSGLTSQDILSNSDYQEWFLEFQGTISQFGSSTGTYMRDIIAYGPSTYDFVAVYEATAVENLENAQGRYGDLKIYYPPTTIMSDHPFCVLDAKWVTPEKAEAAQVFIDFLTNEQAQKSALLDHGFRPVDKTISLESSGSPFIDYVDHGLEVSLPPEVELPPGNVLDTLLNFWSRNIQK